MSSSILKWRLNDRINSIEKYCPKCGKKVLFHDSHIRRRNANGKDIFEYAIYKCDRDHTWNRKIREYKAKNYRGNEWEFTEEPDREDAGTLSVREFLDNRIDCIEIRLESPGGPLRLDKILAGRIQDLSRTKIKNLIDKGLILVNHKPVKPDKFLNTGDMISLLIRDFPTEDPDCKKETDRGRKSRDLIL